jgi:hypothetical protein
VLSLVGGFLMLDSIGYNTVDSIIITKSKSEQFSSGIALFLVGLIGIAVVVRFFAVFGKYSIFTLQNLLCNKTTQIIDLEILEIAEKKLALIEEDIRIGICKKTNLNFSTRPITPRRKRLITR